MERSEYVENRLLRIGATPEYVGYPYLLDSILLVWDKPEAGRNITTQVYPAIAQRWGVSAASVERSIRTLIAALWQDQDRRALGQLFGVAACRLRMFYRGGGEATGRMDGTA